VPGPALPEGSGMMTRLYLALAAMFLAFGFAGGAFAQSVEELPFQAAQSVSSDRLASIAGEADIAGVITANNSSNVSGNAVIGHSVTGTISFDNSAFQNLNGLSVLSANTGNNVAINASLNVNVALRP
jgi:hypothetical protein